jgi:hypothetical protein
MQWKGYWAERAAGMVLLVDMHLVCGGAGVGACCSCCLWCGMRWRQCQLMPCLLLLLPLHRIICTVSSSTLCGCCCCCCLFLMWLLLGARRTGSAPAQRAAGTQPLVAQPALTCSTLGLW